MILRRITQHVKDQNWFAVALDFFIVLAGILIAFQITNWNEAKSERTELARAEIALQADLGRNYFNAAERVSLTDCRTAQLRGLADRLLAPGDVWEGMPRLDSNALPRAIEPVLRSPRRIWGSRIWQAGLAGGLSIKWRRISVRIWMCSFNKPNMPMRYKGIFMPCRRG